MISSAILKKQGFLMLKKLLIFLLIAAVFLTNFAGVARAATEGSSWYNQSYKEWSAKVFDSPDNEIFGERYTFAQVQWIVYSLSAIMTGGDILKCASLLETDQTKLKDCVDKLGPVKAGETSSRGFGGALMGAGFAADALLSARPASGVEYVSNIASRFHLIPEAYAQGIGFKSIEPVQKLWKAFRNMAYAFLVIVTLAMAFMIMFRVKISPQVVISVQSALPKLVGILILITFSYAIAGFLIDISYLIIGLFVMFAKSQGLVGNLTPPIGVLEIAQRAWGGGLTAAWPIASLLFLVTFPLVLIGLLLVGGVVFGAIAGGVTSIPFIIGGAILLIIFVFILIQIVKTLWAMLKAFINVLLLIIFGPLLIMFGGFSPTIGGFGMWFKNLAANIAVFPTVALMGFIAHLLYWSFPHTVMDIFREGSWVNPFEIEKNVASGAQFSLPLFTPGGFAAPVLAALAIILIMPSAAELIKSIISGQPFNYGQAIGQSFALPTTLGKGAVAWRSGIAEEAKQDAYKLSGSSLPYVPHWSTRALKAIGWSR